MSDRLIGMVYHQVYLFNGKFYLVFFSLNLIQILSKLKLSLKLTLTQTLILIFKQNMNRYYFV